MALDADVTGKWNPLSGLKMTRWDGLTDDDLDLVDDWRAWQAIKHRDHPARRKERTEASVRESNHTL